MRGGSDMKAHYSALISKGPTIAVLPYGINHFNINKIFRLYPCLKSNFDPLNLLVISQFPPDTPFSVSAAMERNHLIIALSSALFITESNLTGGTMAAAKVAISSGLPVYVSARKPVPAGNSYLINESGASSIDVYIRDFYYKLYGPTCKRHNIRGIWQL